MFTLILEHATIRENDPGVFQRQVTGRSVDLAGGSRWENAAGKSNTAFPGTRSLIEESPDCSARKQCIDVDLMA